jgi:hypothetical protein
MFFTFLANVRKKPEYVRYQIALWGAVLVTGFIAVVFTLTHIAASGILGSRTYGGDESETARTREINPLAKPDNIFQTPNVFEYDEAASAPVADALHGNDVSATTTVQVPVHVSGEGVGTTGTDDVGMSPELQNGAE